MRFARTTVADLRAAYARHPSDSALHVGETGQRVIVYCAAPGSPTQEAFRGLAAAGGSAYHRAAPGTATGNTPRSPA